MRFLFWLLICLALLSTSILFAQSSESDNEAQESEESDTLIIDDEDTVLALLPFTNKTQDKAYDSISVSFRKNLYKQLAAHNLFVTLGLEDVKTAALKHELSQDNISDEHTMLAFHQDTKATTLIYGEYSKKDPTLIELKVSLLSIIMAEVAFTETYEIHLQTISEDIQRITAAYVEILEDKYDEKTGMIAKQEETLRPQLEKRIAEYEATIAIKKTNQEPAKPAVDMITGQGIMGMKIGFNIGMMLNFSTFPQSQLDLSRGIGVTLEWNFLRFGKSSFDMGVILGFFQKSKGFGITIENALNERTEGAIIGKYITIPVGVKFRYAKGWDIGVGWLIPSLSIRYESNIFHSGYFLALETEQQHAFSAILDPDGTREAGDEVQAFRNYEPSVVAGLGLTWLSNFGEIALEVSYGNDIIPSMDEAVYLVWKASNVEIEPFLFQDVMITLSVAIPFYRFAGKRIYKEYQEQTSQSE